MELGKGAEKLQQADKVPENIVQGCQSVMYLHTTYSDGKLYFTAESEALISAGLAYLLTSIYSGESPETVLKTPPDYLDELQIPSSLTPSRANGLYSLHLRIKQEALKQLVSNG